MLVVRQKLARPSSCFVSCCTAFLSTSARQQKPEPLSTSYSSARSDLQIHGRSWQPTSKILSKDIFQPVYAKLHQRIMSASNLKKYSECLSVATEMKVARVKPDLAVYNSLISTAADEAAWLDTWAIFDDMLLEGVRPDVVTMNHLIRAQRFRSSHYLWRAIEKLVELGIEANAMTISHIIERFVYDGNLEGALKYLLSTEQRGLVPEAKSAQKVIIMAAQQNHARLAVELAIWFEKKSVRKLDRVVWVHCLLSSAENLYSEGVSTCWPVVRGLKINPSLGLVSAVLNAAARHGLSALAFDVLATMQSLGTPILEHNFAAIIEACCRDGKIKQALTLLTKMRNEGLEITERTTIPILNAIDRDIQTIDETWAIIDQMHQEGTLIDISAFRVIIQASVSLGDLQRAMGTYKSLSDFGVTPDVSTYNVLLHGCISARHRQLGDVLVAEMGESGVQPNQETFETMVRLSLSQEDYEDAFYFLEEMKSLSYVPSLDLYETLVRRCSLSNDPRGDTVMDDMRQCGYRISSELIRPVQHLDNTDSTTVLNENARKFIETGGIQSSDA